MRDQHRPEGTASADLLESEAALRERVGTLERRLRKRDEQRRAMLHIMTDLNEFNKRLGNQRKAMLHILGDYERDRSRLARQTDALDLIGIGVTDREHIARELQNAMRQVHKATEIISHLRTFGRVAPVSRELVSMNQVIGRALSLMQEQLRLREIEVELDVSAQRAVVMGNPIQLEQVLINLLTNARDALAESPRKIIHILCEVRDGIVELAFSDTGPGIPEGLERRIFDPFFTTKEVGRGTGLGLSIT